jgi:hypothetical protein
MIQFCKKQKIFRFCNAFVTHYVLKLFYNKRVWRIKERLVVIRKEKIAAEIEKLNQLMTAHHDIKLQFANLSGGKDADIVTWTDPGVRVYSRNYLRYEAPELQIIGE